MPIHPDASGYSHIATANLFTTAIAAREDIAEASDSKRPAASKLREWSI